MSADTQFFHSNDILRYSILFPCKGARRGVISDYVTLQSYLC